MSEVSPSADPTPPAPADPSPPAAPDPGPWAPPDAGGPGGHGPGRIPAAVPPPAGWGHPPAPGSVPPGWAPGTVPPGWAPPPTPGATPPGWSAPGPQAYAHPWPYGHPATPPARPRRGSAAGATVAVAAVLVLVLCGALGAVGLLRWADMPDQDRPVAEQPYDGPFYEGDDEDDEEPWPASPALTASGAPGTTRVVYEVTGDGPVALEYYDANGDFVQEPDVSLPWRLDLTTRDADRLMVLAHTWDGQARLACRITVNGRTVERQTATGYGTSCFG
ncbi:MmpS family transport accessory protein [Micromonospora costi]|uniref:MmpS family transport accessory protein n=1 Tax=Micromonospora costi TaxID=1530042 RepID=UPI0033D947B7